MSYTADITIIGAGVVGLAIAEQVAREDREVYVLEKNERFGQETSSRNSEVIHSGMYNREGSLKAKMCVAGNRMLHDLCEKRGIGHSRLGKLTVATSDEEIGELQTLLKRGQANGVEGLRMLSRREIKGLEPNVEAVAAILSPSTSIVDSHALMRYFVTKAGDKGAQVAYQSKVIGIEKVVDAYKVTVEDSSGNSSFLTRALINCAGLHCDKVAELTGIDVARAGYRLHYCKGEYFSVSNNKNMLVKRLIYPIPSDKSAGERMIHTTLDMEGRMRLGPSMYYVDSIDYTIDNQHKQFFYNSARKFLPFIEYDDLEPEMAGIRPKLQPPGGDFRDFVIKDESDKGLPGFINLIGIESPGLTASPAIAEYVWILIKEMFGK
ncbi:NAD(P)/FAD-dependent oxidoreductase [Chloroflexota bacterium]